MKRNLVIAAIAATTLFALPAMAQNRVHTGGSLKAYYVNQHAPSIDSYSPARGRAGSIVTVRGTNFTSGTKIKMGNRLITPTYISRTALKFRVPKNASDGAIHLKVPKVNQWYRVGSFNVVTPQPRPNYNSAAYKRAFRASAKVKAELSYNREQIKKLRHMRSLAKQYGLSDLTYCANQSIDKENLRHKRAMAELDREFRIVWNNRYYRQPKRVEKPAKKKTWSWYGKLSFSLL